MTEAVRLTDVSKSFGAVRAVDGINLTIAAGETVALLGPNGAGKSTTINMMLGLTRPGRGTVEVFGTSPDRAVQGGNVGAMLQDAGFVPNATVRDLVELARALYPAPLPTPQILRTAGLTELADRRLDKLSGGEAQRARFAFALAGDPRLLVLDEPTAAMDVVTRQSFWAAMRRYSAAGHTVLFATHYLEEADDYADRVVVVAQGRIVADGTGADIRSLTGGRTVTFDLAGEGTAGLDRLPGVRAVEVRGDRANLRSDDSDATVAALVHSGRSFRNLEVSAAGLQEAFLALTAESGPAGTTTSFAAAGGTTTTGA
ncbi:ABC transporter ATP-binding protein [Rugosimonospora africana]|uniref:ABC transporter ATP-binding protein n=1 Tax=Rugosimonospora africana TaxID=556532 RepID=A0A8J3VP79_9ACTN|nr:ABC transporter ATP-binding protein [Rugosimonospora africana]GIH13091.1 ABC transporter ATP-binding protein [Rugosimonospora africana]